MKTNNTSLISWFRGSFYLGISFTLFAIGARVFEIVKNGTWLDESLIGHLGIGLLFLYFSGRPMMNEFGFEIEGTCHRVCYYKHFGDNIELHYPIPRR